MNARAYIAMFETQVALVVDDSVAISQIVNQLLRNDLKFGKVINANNGRQALQWFKSERIDWIFSDYEMPEMNGLELLAAVRDHNRGKDLPFILMTAHADKETLIKVMEAGATDFLAKPFNPATFIQKVQRIAGQVERRVAERIPISQPNRCRIMFSATVLYKAEMVNVSATGCLLRTLPFRQGGMIYDLAQLSLELNGKTATSKSLLVRLEVDRNDAANKSMLAAFHFLDLDEPNQQVIKEFLNQQSAAIPVGG